MSTRNSIILTRTKAAAAADGTSPPPPQGDGEAQEEETVHSQSKQEKEFKAAETSSVEKESNHTAAIQTSEKGEAVNSDTTSSDSDDDDFDIEKFYKSAFEDADIPQMPQQEKQEGDTTYTDIPEEVLKENMYRQAWGKRKTSKRELERALVKKRSRPTVAHTMAVSTDVSTSTAHDTKTMRTTTSAYATTKATTSGNDLSDSDDEDFPPGPISSAYDEPEDHKFVPMRSHFSDLTQRSKQLAETFSALSRNEDFSREFEKTSKPILVTLINPYEQETTRTCYPDDTLSEAVKYASEVWAVDQHEILCQWKNRTVSQSLPLRYLIGSSRKDLTLHCKYLSDELAEEEKNIPPSAASQPVRRVPRLVITLKCRGKHAVEYTLDRIQLSDQCTLADALDHAAEKWEVSRDAIGCEVDGEKQDASITISRLIEEDDLEDYEDACVQVDCNIQS